MYLIQILLPLRDNAGRPFPREELDRVRDELADRFGGATAYLRSPAHGIWKEGDASQAHDDVVMIEAMAERLDRDWWSAYRKQLERRFRQKEIVVRALPAEAL